MEQLDPEGVVVEHVDAVVLEEVEVVVDREICVVVEQSINHLRPTSLPPVVEVLAGSRVALVVAVDFEVEAADFGVVEVLLAAPEGVRQVENCSDKDRNPHRLHHRCSGRCDLVEARKELEARHEAHQWTDD